MTYEEAVKLIKLGKNRFIKVYRSFNKPYYVVFLIKGIKKKEIPVYKIVIGEVVEVMGSSTFEEAFLSKQNTLFAYWSEINLDNIKVVFSFKEGLNFLIDKGKISLEEAVHLRLSI